MSDRTSVWTAQRASVSLFVLLAIGAGNAGAHEGHPAIPTTGATVHGDQLLLSERARKAVGLATAKVTLADMQSYVRANGKIRVPWRQRCYVTTLVSGVVDEVLVRPGDELKRGQVLARLNSLELEQIQLDLLQASSDYAHFSDMYARRKQMSQAGTVFDVELFEATQKREEAASRFEVATAKLKAVGFDDDTLRRIRLTSETVGQIEIRSPMPGALVHADIRAGQAVDREQHLFQVVDNSVVWCVADVLETDSGSVKTGQPVTVEVASLGGAAIGRVDHIKASVDPKKRAVSVVVEMENKSLKLRPGMSARIVVRVAKSEQAVVCPRGSLLRFGGDTFVLLKRGEGKFVRRQVEIGRIGATQVEVLNGVFPGDQVTSSGTHLLGALFQRAESKDARPASLPASPPSQTVEDDGQLLTATGVVELPTSSKIFATSRVRGRVKRIFVELSQLVKKGDPLAEIESMELFDLQLELYAQNLERRWTERHIARLTPLSQTGTIPKKDVRQLQNELRKLKHEVATLSRRLVAYGLDQQQIGRLLAADAAETNIADLVSRTVTIRAPHDGLIANFDLAPGRVVDSHDHHLFEIHDPSQFWIKVYVFGRQADAVAHGQYAEVRFAADPSSPALGRVVRIAPTSAEAQLVFPVWIELDESPGSLREGMLAKAVIHGSQTPSMASSGGGEGY